MSALIIFIAVALFLLVLLLRWVRRSAEVAPPRRDLSSAQEALAAFRLELPSHALVEKIFSLQDWDFVSNHAPLQVRQMFLRERTRMARAWLRQTKSKVGTLMRFYRIAARQSQGLRPAAEAKLAAQYLAYLLVHATLSALIGLRGPFGAKEIVQYCAGLAEQLYSTAVQALLEIDPAALSKVKAESAAD